MRFLLCGDEEMTAAEVEQITAAARGVEVVWARTAAEAAAAIPQAEALWGLPTPAQFAAASRLRWIQYPGAGVEKLFKIPTLATSEVVVTNARGIFAETMAEHTLGMVIYFCRFFAVFAAARKKRHWAQAEGRAILNEVKGQTLGIIGLGATGHAIAARAKAFGMNILAVTPSTKEKPDYIDSLWNMSHLDEVLARADFVAIAAALTAETTGLLGAAQLAQMKRTAYLINVARGAIVDQDALVDALAAGRLAGAALDVFDAEPLPRSHPLWQLDNVFITPHIAGDSVQHRQRVIALALENLQRFQNGQKLINQVDKSRGY